MQDRDQPRWERRPPPFHNTITFLIFLVVATAGGIIGGMVAGREGVRIGFIVMGISALILPYRRWLTRLLSRDHNET